MGKIFKALIVALIACFQCEYSIAVSTNNSEKCPNLEVISSEIFSKQKYWQFVHLIEPKGPDVTKTYLKQSIKKFFQIKEFDQVNFVKYLNKFSQSDCKSVTATTPDGKVINYKITAFSPFKVELTPQNDTELNSDATGINVDRIVYTVKRLSGFKILDKTVYVHFKNISNSTPHPETHLVEIHSTISWDKPITLKRVISEKLLKNLATIFNEYSGNDFSPDAIRNISSTDRNTERFDPIKNLLDF